MLLRTIGRKIGILRKVFFGTIGRKPRCLVKGACLNNRSEGNVSCESFFLNNRSEGGFLAKGVPPKKVGRWLWKVFSEQ